MNNTAVVILLTILCSPLCATIKEADITNDNFTLLKSSLVEFHNTSHASHTSENLSSSLVPLQSEARVFLARVTTWDLKNHYFTFNNGDDVKKLIENKSTWCAIHWYYLKPDIQVYINYKDNMHPDLLVFKENNTLKVINRNTRLKSKY